MAEEKPDRKVIAATLAGHSAAILRLRGPDADVAPKLAAARDRLRVWQAARLRASYADLLTDERHKAAATFFLDDLYGAANLALRDAEYNRVASKLARLLPLGALEATLLAFELDALTESLDLDVAQALLAARADDPVSAKAYAIAYRAVGRPADRERQVALIGEIGRRLQRLARLPAIGATLALTAAPARALGVETLHGFVRRGLSAFRAIGDAGPFLARIEAHETALMKHLRGGGTTEDFRG